MKHYLDCMLWKGQGIARAPSPIYLARLTIETDEIPELKRILLKMRLTYPEETPVRCCENTLKNCFSFRNLVSYINEEPCPATACSDHIYIQKERIQMFLKRIEKIEREEEELCQTKI